MELIIHHYCPRCNKWGNSKVEAERQHYVYDSGEFKCPKCGYTGYSDDFDKRHENSGKDLDTNIY